MAEPYRNPPWPEPPPGTNPFDWILRTAPKVREARRQAAGRYRMEHQHEREAETRPAIRPGDQKAG